MRERTKNFLLWTAAVALAILAVGIALSGCATVQPAPTATEQQKAREYGERIVKELDFGVTVIDGAKPMVSLLPASLAAEKVRVFCALARTTGRSATVNSQDLAAAEQACGAAIPEAGQAPLVRAAKLVASATSCASLASSVAQAKSVVDGLLAELDKSADMSVRFVALSLRSGMALLIAYKGGAACG